MKSFTRLTNTEKKLINGGNGCDCYCMKITPIKINDCFFIGPTKSKQECKIKCGPVFPMSTCISLVDIKRSKSRKITHDL